MFIIISTIKSACITLSPYSFKFKISWENWGSSVHDWAWAAPLAWLTTMSFFMWMWGSTETSKRQTHTTFHHYLHPRHDSLLPTAFPPDRFPLYHKIRPLLRPTHSCLPFRPIPLLSYFRTHLKVKPDSLLSQSEHQCWSWTRTQGLSSEFQTCESSCPCATSTLGHLRITMSKIQLPILPLNPVPTTNFPISIFYMFGQKIWGGYLLPIMATSDVVGKSISSVFKLCKESAPMATLLPPLWSSQNQNFLSPPHWFLSLHPHHTSSLSDSSPWAIFGIVLNSVSILCSNLQGSQEPQTDSPATQAAIAGVPPLILCSLQTRVGPQVSWMPPAQAYLWGFGHAGATACNILPHGAFQKQGPPSMNTHCSGDSLKWQWPQQENLIGGFRIWVCFGPSEGPENTTLTQARCSNIVMLEELVGVALPVGRAI